MKKVENEIMRTENPCTYFTAFCCTHCCLFTQHHLEYVMNINKHSLSSCGRIKQADSFLSFPMGNAQNVAPYITQLIVR